MSRLMNRNHNPIAAVKFFAVAILISQATTDSGDFHRVAVIFPICVGICYLIGRKR